MKNPKRLEVGNVLIMLLITVLVLGGLATVMLQRTQREQAGTSASLHASRLLYVAEGGLNYNYLQLESDPLRPVKDTTGFAWNATTMSFASGAIDMVATNGGKSQPVRLDVQYLQGTTPVAFANRATPTETYDRIRVACSAANSTLERRVVAWYQFQLGKAFRGALVSDMLPIGTASGDKSGAQNGHIVIETGSAQHAIFGDIKANGTVRTQSTVLTEANASALLTTYAGNIESNLAGAEDEIPDYTNLGGTDQLFDFDRFEAAATAGAGRVFPTIAAFNAAMNAANGLGTPLEGITVLKIDPAVEGGGPKIELADVPGGINIRGTLVFRFKDGTDPLYKVFIVVPLNVNAANLAGFDPTIESTYTSGYPGIYTDPAKRPSAVSISPTFKNFVVGEDSPAIMFNNGIVDIHHAANVCGVVYGPSFVEIENKSSQLQYVNGAIFGGGGILLEGKAGGVQAIRFDPNTINELETMGNKGKGLTITGRAVER